MLRWFMALYENDIIEEGSFLKWKEDVNDTYPGKGKALFQVQLHNLVQSQKGHWAVYYTGPQTFNYNVFLFVVFTTLRTLVNFDWMVY